MQRGAIEQYVRGKSENMSYVSCTKTNHLRPNMVLIHLAYDKCVRQKIYVLVNERILWAHVMRADSGLGSTRSNYANHKSNGTHYWRGGQKMNAREYWDEIEG